MQDKDQRVSNNLIFFLRKKISVFICPEGTFNMTHQPLKSFYDGAFVLQLKRKSLYGLFYF